MAATTQLFVLSIYQANPEVPLSGRSLRSITSRGRLLCLDAGLDTPATTLLDSLYMPDGLAISKALGRIFWTNMGMPNKNDGSLHSAKLDGSDVRPVLSSGVAHTPKQITLHERTGKLMFCDREGMRVHRCNIDGSEHEVLVQTGDWQNEQHRMDQSRWCVGVASSQKLEKIFWTQKGAPKSGQGRILSADINIPAGASPASRPDIEVVASGLPEPIDLEVDDEAGTLYWTDRGEFPYGNTLNRKTIRGQAPKAESTLGREILAEGFGEAIGLALDKTNGCVWVADLCGRVWRCNADGPAAKKKVFESETSVLTGLSVLPSDKS